ncbi:hypothetical protein MUN78_03630 [Leucobacter allii]|uniref:ABC transporter permease n=1 Tax=Leucobacter allii TaxID=2932247 RepID=A0ABY4FNW2_9MICO|nr:hypothetical protein [Leucobacter allii]UOQ57942.1 hypothetical protein MUN78_03630 [Leucobacter allii]
MSEDRETPAPRAAEAAEPSNPGAPVEESEASRTEVLRAVERATQQPEEEAAGEPAPAAAAAGAPADEPTAAPEAADAETAVAADPEAAETARRQAISEVDTQLDLEKPDLTAPREPLTPLDDLPSAAEPPVRDGEIRISADHPMAALYTQTPVPPDLRGNRGAGVLIALLATVGFAIVYAGVLALWLAPHYPPSAFVTDGLVPWLTSLPVIAAAVAFFVGLVLLVLVVGRAGWWAYVLGGFAVAALVWAAATASLAYFGTPDETPQEMIGGALGGFDNLPEILNRFGLTVPTLAAALVAREATVWFGAWIGARGRRMKLRNAEALAEYEAALAEVQAKRP